MPASSLVDSYENLLLHNLGSVRTVESTLRNVTWLLPGRFEDAELASEALSSILNLVSSYHDTLLARHIDPSHTLPPRPFASSSAETGSAAQERKPGPALPPPSDHTRYTRYWADRSPLYRRAARALTTIGYVELLVEMVVRKRGGDRTRWRVVAVMETLKSILRLLIFGITRRAVLSPATPQREYDLSSMPDSIFASSRAAPAATPPTGTGASTTPALLSIPPAAPLRSHLFPLINALPPDHQQYPVTLLPEMSGLSAYSAEILTCTATLVQVVLFLRTSSSNDSVHRQASLASASRYLTPILVPLSMHLLARHLRQPPNDSLLLAEHYAQQDRRLATRFFLTGPMWVGWTRPKIVGITKTLERIPLVGLVAEFAESYLGLVDEYFYYTSS